jgi:short-subunit dehydrogenase
MSTSPTDPRSPAIVITGASAGIGRALACEFAKRGWRLGLAARRLDALEALREELHAQPASRTSQIEVLQLDVDDEYTVAPRLTTLFDALGTVEVVVVNAGINAFSSVGRGEFDTERRILRTNLFGALATIDAAAARFIAQRSGHLVAVTSVAAKVAVPRQAAYCASKAGLEHYMNSARIELARHGITVGTFLPGFVVTDIMPNIGKYPFAIPADVAARDMARAIIRRRRTAFIPSFPWRWLHPLLNAMPVSLWRRLG